MAANNSKLTNFFMALFGGLFMGGYGGYIAFGALGFFEIQGIMVEPWIAACAGFMFLLSGMGMLIAAINITLPTKSKKKTNVINPAEGGVGVLTTWGGCIFVLLLVSMFWGLILTDAKMEGNMPMWMLIIIISMFTLVGIGLLIYALWLTANYLQFGNIKLTIENYPPRVGERLKARISLPRLEKLQTLDATLKCYLIRSSSIGNAQNPGDVANIITQTMRAHWQDTKHVIVTRHHLGAYAQIEFKLPDDLPAANWFAHQTNNAAASNINSRNLCRWVLEIEKEIAGPDLKRTYEIPIHPIIKEIKADQAIDEAARKMSQQDAVANVAKAEIEKGTDLSTIAANLAGLGITQHMINSGYRKILVAGDSQYEDKILAYLEEQQRKKYQHKLKTSQKVKRIREIVVQQRKTKTDLLTSPLSELELDDIIRYTKYIFSIAPFIYFLYTLYIFFN